MQLSVAAVVSLVTALFVASAVVFFGEPAISFVGGLFGEKEHKTRSKRLTPNQEAIGDESQLYYEVKSSR